MAIKGAIFDMDGTIMDSMHVWRGLGQRYLENEGIPVTEELDNLLRGLGVEQAAEMFHRDLRVPRSVEEITKQIYDSVAAAYLKDIQPKPGAAAYLEALHKQGLPLCLLTATDKHLTIPALQRVGLLPYFRWILTCGELQMHKDQPDIYRKTAGLMGLLPEETVVFEDAPHAVRSAREAGCYVVAVRDETFAASLLPDACETIDNWPWKPYPFPVAL